MSTLNTIKKEHVASDGTRSWAVYSACEKYRYALRRDWADGNRRLLFVMLNPSTATELENDPTVHRCEMRARMHGYSGFTVLNIFAYRATQPTDMKAQADPVGPENDAFIVAQLQEPETADVICAWGTHGAYKDRGTRVLELFDKAKVTPKVLRLSKQGHPCHPLYLPYDLIPQEWARDQA